MATTHRAGTADDSSRTAEDASSVNGRRPLFAVLAVKGLDDAKSRLSHLLDAPTRRDLVLAMAIDTIAAAIAAGADRVLVVTPDARVAEQVISPSVIPLDEYGTDLQRANTHGVGDRQALPVESGLNRAYRIGSVAALARAPDARILVVQADLPSLRPDHLRAAVHAAARHPRAFIPDRSATGTAALMVQDTSDVTTHFGPGSARLHATHGAVDLVGDEGRWPDLRADVDTVDDLRAAVALGVGPRTATVLDRIDVTTRRSG